MVAYDKALSWIQWMLYIWNQRPLLPLTAILSTEMFRYIYQLHFSVCYYVKMTKRITMAVLTVIIVAAIVAFGAITTFTTPAYSQSPIRLKEVPMATSGNNVFMAWANNDTGHYNVFFGKSTDGGKTIKTMMISAPNKGHVVDQDTQISASGGNVYVTWWTNKTGTLMPVFRASNDGGNAFGKTIMLNSTG